ncbi:hypothetical protein NT239_04760 [Chitinibacter sp. SCUT-21]|uniref:hypothetical protein n=1 Tax=Chitinibacter sp. SCUT-21 TaxID=2970891 RepID=UPI0035A66414
MSIFDNLQLLWAQLWKPQDKAVEITICPERNYIFDILEEGKKKNSIHLLGEAKIGRIKHKEHLSSQKSQDASLTCQIIQIFSQILNEHPEMHAYLKGRRQRVIFQNVDLACMVERELADGSLQPLHYIIRDCEKKNLSELQHELNKARNAPIGNGGPLTSLEMWFMTWPRWCRKLIWLWIKYDPYTSKQLIGTAGVTSMGMHSQNGMLVIPISPLTITLSIGGVEKRRGTSSSEEHDDYYLKFALTANHDVIDGAPLMRFAEKLKNKIESQLNGSDQHAERQ